MGSAIDAWIEYDDDSQYYPERAAEPPFSRPHDNCIPLDGFSGFRQAKDYRFFAAISGIRSQIADPEPLFPIRAGFPPNVSERTRRKVPKYIDKNDPSLSWLSYTEIEMALAHVGVSREKLALETNLVLDLMQSIDKRLGEGRSRLIFYIE